jgi:hypothetical protein
VSRPAGTSLLAWGLWSVWMALVVLATWSSWDLDGSGDYPILLALVGYATVGALVATRQPGNAIGWLLLAIAVTMALSIAGEAYVQSRSNPAYLAVAWVSGWLFNVWLAIVGVFLPLVFPTGRLLSRRWRSVWWFALVATVATVVVAMLRPGELEVNVAIENPLAVQGAALTVLELVRSATDVTLAVLLALAGLSLVLRFRRSRAVERQQLKWFAYAGLLTVGGLLLAWVGMELERWWFGDLVGAVGWTVFLLTCIFGIPLATGIAILRHRLYDIDLVINRTLVYGALTAALLTTYVGLVLLLRVLLSPLTGHNDLAVAASTLAVAALFRPARARIQELVDRRFYRHKYDAAQTLDAFTNRLRHELDLDAVAHDLSSVASQSVQPSHVSLWLRP